MVIAFILAWRDRPVALTVMVRPVVLAERDIESVHTQVIVQTFSDRVLVIVTQLQKVGTLVRELCFILPPFISHSIRSKPPCQPPSLSLILHQTTLNLML